MAKANLEAAHTGFPSINSMGEEEWAQFFSTREGTRAMGRIIGDIFREVRAQEDKERGLTKMGRRPRPTGTLDEVWAVVFPQQYTMDPFPVALKRLMAGRSTRAFAPRIPCAQSTLVRLLNGQLTPDMQTLESIAAAAKVKPFYFVEYRAMYVAHHIREVLTSQPHLGITVWKQMAQAVA